MSIGKIQTIKEKDGYSQLMYIDDNGSYRNLLLTARELSVGQDRANKNLEVLSPPTFIDKLFSFLLRLFSR
jgi:hypothetical protein